MGSLRVLITNNGLALRGGSELYVRDLATALLARGHSPIAYSTCLGEVAQEIRTAAVPVVSNLDAVAAVPDVIHGHHHLDVMTALLHFPGVPALCFCHGWFPWQEAAPRFPRIRRYAAVSQACRDRLIFEEGIPEDKAVVIPNFVDLERFAARGPLPCRPGRALVFNNHATEATFVAPVRAACAAEGIALDVVGVKAGKPCARPEAMLGGYDLVFATGRSALEALAVGAAVVLIDQLGCGPMVTAAEFEHLRSCNFALRALRERITPANLVREIRRYDAADAAAVSRRVRREAGREQTVDQLVALYRDVIDEQRQAPADASAESRAAATYLRWLAPTLKERDELALHSQHFRAECERLQTPLPAREHLRALLHATAQQLRRGLRNTPLLGKVCCAMARLARPSP